MAQTSGIVPSLYDGTKKTAVVPMGTKKKKKRGAK